MGYLLDLKSFSQEELDQMKNDENGEQKKNIALKHLQRTKDKMSPEEYAEFCRRFDKNPPASVSTRGE